jgi:hypothetical protein
MWKGGHCEPGVHEAELLLSVTHYRKRGLDTLPFERIEALRFCLLDSPGQNQLVDLTHWDPPASLLRALQDVVPSVNTEFGGVAIRVEYLGEKLLVCATKLRWKTWLAPPDSELSATKLRE